MTDIVLMPHRCTDSPITIWNEVLPEESQGAWKKGAMPASDPLLGASEPLASLVCDDEDDIVVGKPVSLFEAPAALHGGGRHRHTPSRYCVTDTMLYAARVLPGFGQIKHELLRGV